MLTYRNARGSHTTGLQAKKPIVLLWFPHNHTFERVRPNRPRGVVVITWLLYPHYPLGDMPRSPVRPWPGAPFLPVLASKHGAG